MKSDEALKKTFKIFADKNDIIHLIAFSMEKDGRNNTRSTQLVEEEIVAILNNNPRKQYTLMVDITPCGKVGYGFSQESRKIGTKIANHKQLRKVAAIAPSTFLKTIINFIAIASGKGNNMKLFSGKEEALKWLKAKD